MSGTPLLTLISPAVAVVVAFWGFRRSTRADRLRAFFEMHEQYLMTDVRLGRRVLHRSVSGRAPSEMPNLDPDELRKAGYALAIMNAIAIGCEGGYVDRRMVAQSMGRSYIAAIASAKPYIDYLETVRGFRPYPFGRAPGNSHGRSTKSQFEPQRPDRRIVRQPSGGAVERNATRWTHPPRYC